MSDDAWSSAQSPRCWFCGAGKAWWQCSCTWSSEARLGKRPKPRVIHKHGQAIVLLDEETITRNPLGLTRYVKPAVTPNQELRNEPKTNAERQKAWRDRQREMRNA